MPTGSHIADQLQPLVRGELASPEREQAEAHLHSCPACREERDLLVEAQGLFERLPELEPRTGFAVRVAAAAQEARAPGLARWLRFAVAGVAAAAVAAVVLTVVVPPAPMHSHDVLLAQRLDLFEDLDVVQNQQALEDLEVVEVLHTLEARP